jgi:hypothetical protein
MTPYKILTLFRIHKQFNSEKFKPEPRKMDIDDILGD